MNKRYHRTKEFWGFYQPTHSETCKRCMLKGNPCFIVLISMLNERERLWVLCSWLWGRVCLIMWKVEWKEKGDGWFDSSIFESRKKEKGKEKENEKIRHKTQRTSLSWLILLHTLTPLNVSFWLYGCCCCCFLKTARMLYFSLSSTLLKLGGMEDSYLLTRKELKTKYSRLDSKCFWSCERG